MKITTGTARVLKLPPGVKTDYTHFDEDLPGFGVRCRASGTARYVVQYKVGGKNRRLVLGSVSQLDATKARAQAKDILAAIRLGKDPVADRLEDKVRAGETFGGPYLVRFLERQRAKLKPRSLEEATRHLTKHCRSLSARPIDRIDRRTLATLLADIADNSGPGAANRVRASVSAYLSWCAREGIVDSNAATYTNRAVENGAREHVVNDAELAKIWKAAGDDQYGAIVKLLLLTGCRRDEIGGLRWQEVDLDKALLILPGERTKSRREFLVPLSPAAVEILRRLRLDAPTSSAALRTDFQIGAAPRLIWMTGSAIP